MSAHEAESAQVREAREARLPYCPACSHVAHDPGRCECQNLGLGRCVCPDPGFEHGLPRLSNPPGKE